jgi:hypothetical protein
MLAKMTSRNRLTLPKAVVSAVGEPKYFDVQVRHGNIVLTPMRVQGGDAARAKLALVGVRKADVRQALTWARADKKSLRGD